MRHFYLIVALCIWGDYVAAQSMPALPMSGFGLSSGGEVTASPLPGGALHYYQAETDCPGIGAGNPITTVTNDGTATDVLVSSGTARPTCEQNGDDSWYFSFDGSNDFMEVDFADISQTLTFCVEYNLRLDDGKTFSIVLDGYDADLALRHQFGRRQASPTPDAVSFYNGAYADSTVEHVYAEYSHVCVLSDGTNTRLNVNGVEYTPATGGTSQMGGLTVGALNDTVQYNAPMDLKWVIVWDSDVYNEAVSSVNTGDGQGVTSVNGDPGPAVIVEASDIDYSNATSGLTAIQVQAAIDELAGMSYVTSVNGDTGPAVSLVAADVPYDNVASGLIAIEVQAAIDELAGMSYVVSVNGQSGPTVVLDSGDISYDNATSGLTATDAQAAIDELAAAPEDLLLDASNSPLTGTLDAQIVQPDVNITRTLGAPGRNWAYAYAAVLAYSTGTTIGIENNLSPTSTNTKSLGLTGVFFSETFTHAVDLGTLWTGYARSDPALPTCSAAVEGRVIYARMVAGVGALCLCAYDGTTYDWENQNGSSISCP